MQIIDIFLW